jgi:hypothetical protein
MTDKTDSFVDGNLRGVARPVAKLRAAMRMLHGEGATIPLAEAIDSATAITQLAEVLEVAASRSLREDGTLDYCVMAACVIKDKEGAK